METLDRVGAGLGVGVGAGDVETADGGVGFQGAGRGRGGAIAPVDRGVVTGGLGAGGVGGEGGDEAVIRRSGGGLEGASLGVEDFRRGDEGDRAERPVIGDLDRLAGCDRDGPPLQAGAVVEVGRVDRVGEVATVADRRPEGIEESFLVVGGGQAAAAVGLDEDPVVAGGVLAADGAAGGVAVADAGVAVGQVDVGGGEDVEGQGALAVVADGVRDAKVVVAGMIGRHLVEA